MGHVGSDRNSTLGHRLANTLITKLHFHPFPSAGTRFIELHFRKIIKKGEKAGLTCANFRLIKTHFPPR